MNTVHRLGVAMALAFSASASAAYLPDPAAAEAALWASPAVAQARGDLAAQSLRSHSLRAGRDEWTVAGDLAQRRVQTTPSGSQGEWGLALSRPIRLPARAAADRALGDALAAHAEASLGEALHESGRQLLTLWFDWLNEASQSRVWQAQIALAEQQLAAVNARIRLGEAPRAERVSMEAALAQSRLQQQQAAARTQRARNQLLAQFPALPVAADGALPPPQPPSGSVEDYIAEVFEHNHELVQARRRAAVLQSEARQLARYRGADPVVGVFYKNEAGGNEHVLGLNVGLKLPGAARRTDQQAAEQLSMTAHEAVIRLEQRLRQESRADYEAALAHSESWQQAASAAHALAEAARLSARAYELGEGSLDQVLLSRRLALEGELVLQAAHVNALSATARLKLDAHQLWPLDVDSDHAHAHP
ncbi:MAG: TolC family protein [Thiobacillus sp.]|nr:TolC family protein [Thiobacillus sp.]